MTGYDSGPDVHNHDQDNEIRARLDPKGIYQLSLILTALHNNRQYVIIVCLKSETMGNQINRIPGSRLLLSRLQGSALRTLVESLDTPHYVNRRFQSLAR